MPIILAQAAMVMSIIIAIQNVLKLTPKILEVVRFVKTKIFYDEMPFDAPVSSETFFNVKNVATSRF
jgi:hypothetical protein